MTEQNKPIPMIAIDGPGGVGKGTLSRALAKAMDWHLLESGALYRLLALRSIEEQVTLSHVADLVTIIKNWNVRFDNGQTKCNNKDVSEQIREPAVEELSSQVAQLQEVRDALMHYQRACLRPPGLVAEGRDMGTVVFKEAPLKIFLTASAECRAERRYRQLKVAGRKDVKISTLLNDIQARDKRDTEREISPLNPANDAVVIDSTKMIAQEVKHKVLNLWEKKINDER